MQARTARELGLVFLIHIVSEHFGCSGNAKQHFNTLVFPYAGSESWS